MLLSPTSNNNTGSSGNNIVNLDPTRSIQMIPNHNHQHQQHSNNNNNNILIGNNSSIHQLLEANTNMNGNNNSNNKTMIPNILQQSSNNNNNNSSYLLTNDFNQHDIKLSNNDSSSNSSSSNNDLLNNSALYNNQKLKRLSSFHSTVMNTNSNNYDQNINNINFIPQQQNHQIQLQNQNLDENSQYSKSINKAQHHGLRRNTQETMAKKIAEKHRYRPLSEYVSVVKDAEMEVLNMSLQTHSKSELQTAEQNRERERQVYAFLWLLQNCESDKKSYVPRGRIFAQYASSCAQNSLKPLSQASLGKLIRAVFPNLTTRRLGIRGQSKYHYCGLKLLINDSIVNDSPNNNNHSNTPKIDSTSQNQFNHHNHNNNMNNNISDSSSTTSSSNQHDLNNHLMINSNDLSPRSNTSNDSSNLFDMNSTSNTNSTNNISTSIQINNNRSMDNNTNNRLVNINDNNNITTRNSSIIIPNEIEMFKRLFTDEINNKSSFSLKFPPIPRQLLSNDTDSDIISSLESLYFVYCNTLFENIEFLRLDEIPKCLSIFNSGSVSPQMYNLFISEQLYDWIYQCDLITHTALIQFLSKLVISANTISDSTLDKLEDFSKNYFLLVSKSIIDLPVPIVTKKLEIAGHFSKLLKKLSKLLKVSKNLSRNINNNKISMKEDWSNLVDFDDICETVTPIDSLGIMRLVKDLVKTQILNMLDSISIDNDSNNFDIEQTAINNYSKILSEFFSEKSEGNTDKLMFHLARFLEGTIEDIILKSTANSIPWFFCKNFTLQFLNYSSEVAKFIASETQNSKSSSS